MKWILGDGSRALWHVAEERSYSYDASRTYLVAQCNGRQIGGAFGPSVFRGSGMPPEIEHARCAKCEALAGKA